MRRNKSLIEIPNPWYKIKNTMPIIPILIALGYHEKILQDFKSKKMSTNKSTEESLGLVPIDAYKAQLMRQLAAHTWFNSLTQDQRNSFVQEHTRHKDYTALYHILTCEDILQCWIHGEVRAWFHTWALDADRAEYDKWCTFLYHYRDGMDQLQAGTNEELADFYLKEHTVKEGGALVPDKKWVNTGLKDESGKWIIKAEEMDTPVDQTSEDAAKKAYPLDRIKSAIFEQGASWKGEQDKVLIDALTANRDEYYRLLQNQKGLNDTANGLIQTLLDALKKMVSGKAVSEFLLEQGTTNAYSNTCIKEAESAITKAENFLGTGTKTTHP